MAASYLLLETGDRLLQEDLYGILLESSTVSTPGGGRRSRPIVVELPNDDEDVLIVALI